MTQTGFEVSMGMRIRVRVMDGYPKISAWPV
ncbi:hypothetical protein [Erwinia sp. S59]